MTDSIQLEHLLQGSKTALSWIWHFNIKIGEGEIASPCYTTDSNFTASDTFPLQKWFSIPDVTFQNASLFLEREGGVTSIPGKFLKQNKYQVTLLQIWVMTSPASHRKFVAREDEILSLLELRHHNPVDWMLKNDLGLLSDCIIPVFYKSSHTQKLVFLSDCYIPCALLVLTP